MCGIAGIVTRDGALPDEGLLQRMSDAIAHRGPDGEGIWIMPGVGLAHRRLAIIDLSPLGQQPMTDLLGQLTITFNGEIYNYRELRRELESSGVKFRTHTDTEVILELYKRWGTGCALRLRGMFVFAIWDQRAKQAFIARDRIGKKPLFYATTERGDVVFASEIKALAAAVRLQPAREDLRLFLGLQYVPAPRTGFQNVQQLLPGSYLVVQAHREIEPKQYHEWATESEVRSPESTVNFSEIDEQIRTRLEDAVRVRQLAADVPVGAFLSGGIDSAAVVAYASRTVSQPLRTFTMGFPNLAMDERREARRIAKYFGTQHTEFEATPEHLQALVESIVHHYDSPYADSSALPLWLLAEQTAKSIKVVLTGDGGDEVFGGYRRYMAYAQASLMARLPLVAQMSLPALRTLSAFSRDPRFVRMGQTIKALNKCPERAYGELFCGSYFDSVRVRELCTPEFFAETNHADAVEYVSKYMSGDSSLSSALLFDLTSYLPDDLNVKMDRATMRFGLEARAPFLDQHVVAYALDLPLNQKVNHGKTKIALKRAMKGIVPDEVLKRPKRGFQVPLADWFRGPLRGLIRNQCEDPASPLFQFFKPTAVRALICENDQGADQGNRLWMLLVLSIWLRQHSNL